MGPLGWQETVFIFLLALLIFGPKKLPELGKTIGKAITEFRRASSELRATWDREVSNLEREHESLKEVTNNYANEISSSTYDSSYYGSEGYDPESYDSTATDTSTVSASATKGAESTAEATPEGAVTATTGDGQPAGTQASGAVLENPKSDTVAASAPSETPAPKSEVVKS
jgi:sec-independent protein translocase protein TatA